MRPYRQSPVRAGRGYPPAHRLIGALYDGKLVLSLTKEQVEQRMIAAEV